MWPPCVKETVMFLARIPFWGWLLLITMALYLVYNPLGVSMWHMWTVSDPTHLLPWRVLASVLLVSVLTLVLHGALKSMSWLGAALIVTLLASVMWAAHALVAFHVLSTVFWSWALQPLLAVVLTVGWQWPRIWRRSTGAVSVSDPDTPS